MNDDTLDITLTREGAFQLLTYLTILRTIASMNPNSILGDVNSDSVAEFIRQIQDFVEGKT